MGGRPGRRKPGDGDVTGNCQTPEGSRISRHGQRGPSGHEKAAPHSPHPATSAIQQAREVAASQDLGWQSTLLAGPQLPGAQPGRLRGPGSQPPRVHMALLPGILWPQSVSAQRSHQVRLLVPRCGERAAPSRPPPLLPGLGLRVHSEVPKAQPSLWHPGTR